MGSVWLGGRKCLTTKCEPLQKCTEYWPEEQAVYDSVEVTVRQVIHTDDYRLRLISLRVRPGTGLCVGLGTGTRWVNHEEQDPGAGITPVLLPGFTNKQA